MNALELWTGWWIQQTRAIAELQRQGNALGIELREELKRIKAVVRAENWTKENPDRAAQNKRNHYEENRQKIIDRTADWRHDNREQYNAHFRTPEHRAKRRPYMKGWRKIQRETNPQYCLASAIRTRLRDVLQGRLKLAASQKLLGCSWSEAVKHIESQFKPGMNWSNRSEWHIDHKRPLASFDLTSLEEQKQASHYSNLQPLWKKENLSKGAKWEGPA
jgi:hypothetical protein